MINKSKVQEFSTKNEMLDALRNHIMNGRGSFLFRINDECNKEYIHAISMVESEDCNILYENRHYKEFDRFKKEMELVGIYHKREAVMYDFYIFLWDTDIKEDVTEENKDFFYAHKTQYVRDKLNELVTEKARREATKYTFDELCAKYPVPDPDIEHNLIKGEEPVFRYEPYIDINLSDVTNYMFGDEKEAIESIYRRNIDKNGTQEYYLQYLVNKKAYDEQKDNVSAEQKIMRRFDEIGQMGYQNVVMELEGHDEDISLYAKRHFPEFSIEGETIVGKYDASYLAVNRRDYDGINEWGFCPTSHVLKESYGNRRVKWWGPRNIPLNRVLTIKYRGKVLYNRKDYIQ